MKKVKLEGFSLVELLLAMALGSILSIAVVSVFSGSVSSYLSQKERANIINDGAFVMDVIGDEISYAGYSHEKIDDYRDTQAIVDAITLSGVNVNLTVNDDIVRTPFVSNDELAIAFRATIHDDNTVDCLGTNVEDNLSAPSTNTLTSVINHYYLTTSATTVNGTPVADLMCQPYIATHAGETGPFQTNSVVTHAGQGPQPLVKNVANLQVRYGVARGTENYTFGNNQTGLKDYSRINNYVDFDELTASDNVLAVQIGIVFIPEDTLLENARTSTYTLLGEQYTIQNNRNVYIPFERTVLLRNNPIDVRSGNGG